MVRIYKSNMYLNTSYYLLSSDEIINGIYVGDIFHTT